MRINLEILITLLQRKFNNHLQCRIQLARHQQPSQVAVSLMWQLKILEHALGHHKQGYQKLIYWWLLVAVVADLDMLVAVELAD
jgi:hypothetical protein